MSKKKLLWVGEASYLNSGYGNYSKELLTRLYATGKYDIAEFASYGNMHDPRVKTIPWKYYANEAEKDDPQEIQKFYRSKISHQFGEWRFDKVLLDFRPDIVADIRDPWMTSYQTNSHLRPYFSHLVMPTADSLYLDPEWIDSYIKADGVLTYTEWGKLVLDNEGGGKIRTLGAAPYGRDYDVFSPAVDKKAHKEKFGIPGDSIIIGTVMRNQKRKLFPDLMEAFANAIDKLPDNIADKTYLYLHTSYPDKSCWDIPRLIIEMGLGKKVIVSYICKLCKATSSQIFQDARARCPHCNNVTCVMPNVGLGHDTQQLVDVFRLFDLYVQYSISEGFGCPQIEAAGCGVPVATVDFSAMQDVGKRLDAYMVKINRYFREFESHMLRAYPDNNHLSEIIYKFAQLPDDYRLKKGLKTRKLCIDYFNWDKTSKIWEDAIDQIRSAKKSWNAAPNIQPIQNLPDTRINNREFIEYLFNTIYKDSECIDDIRGLGLLRDLNFGIRVTSQGMEPLDKKKVVERLQGKTEGRNLAERARCGLIKLTDENFITFANNRSIKR